MKMKIPFLAALCTAAIVLALPANAPAKEKKTATATPEPSASPAAKMRPIGYHGKVVSVDTSANTFMVGKRTIKVTDKTKITKDGAAATISDVTAGGKVSGSYWKQEDGTLEAKSVKLTTMTESSASAGETKKEDKAEPKPSP